MVGEFQAIHWLGKFELLDFLLHHRKAYRRSAVLRSYPTLFKLPRDIRIPPLHHPSLLRLFFSRAQLCTPCHSGREGGGEY